MDITFTISKEEHDVLESWMGVGAVEGWLQHALDNRIRKLLDHKILTDSDMNPKKMDKVDKLLEIKRIKDKAMEEVI